MYFNTNLVSTLERQSDPPLQHCPQSDGILVAFAQDPPKSLDEFRVGPQTQRQAMTPEALALAEKRIEMEMRDRTREFARTAADKHEEASMHGVGTSSMLILSIHALTRTELDARARSALATAQRAFTADDAEPSD